MSPVASLRAVVIDCPDPRALARFYADVAGGTPEDDDPEWVVLRLPGGPSLAFQRAPGLTPPEWPRADRNSQQFHLDFDGGATWEEIEAAQEKVLALGARLLHAEDGDNWRVYADPAGHPFCLCRVARD